MQFALTFARQPSPLLASQRAMAWRFAGRFTLEGWTAYVSRDGLVVFC